MRFGILGPLDVRGTDDAPVAVGGPKVRALLGLLLLNAGELVPRQRLIDGLYGEEPPAGVANALQSQVSRLRQALPGLVEFHPAGYRLAVEPGDVDAHRFERLAARGRAALSAGEHAAARSALHEALALWRGPALADVPELAADRLEELRLATTEDRVEADLAISDPAPLVAELRGLVAAHPLRERLRVLLVRALHAGGRQAEALAAFDEARRFLADELGADPSTELATAHAEVLRADQPVPAARQPVRGVPEQLTSFVGRDAEITEVRSLLGTTRLVTLTGPGGTGKTRLAIEAVRSHSGEVCFVELAPLTTGTDLPQAVLDALSLRETTLATWGSGRRPAVERLVNALAERDLLLVLDNCEHIVDAAAELAGQLLGQCPHVRILATSREALGLTGERLCPVPQLAVPPLGQPDRDVLDYAAVRLFTERAAAAAPGFEANAERIADVVRICRALDGLPLAIELAAARVRSLPVPQVAARLDDRFRLLSRGSRTAAPRHRTLRAVVEWSWDLLDDTERTLARRLTVFSGGATIAAVGRVCDVPAETLPDVLAGLVEKSLVDLGADSRYRMLETVRAYGAERLTEAGERERLQRAHAEYYLELTSTAAEHVLTAAQLDWLRRLDAEQDNLHAAFRWAAADDTRTALRLLAALLPCWWLRGRRTEAATLAAELLADLEPGAPPGLAEEYAMCVLSAAFEAGQDRLAEHLPAMKAEFEGVMSQLRARHPFLLVLWGAMNGIPGEEIAGSLRLRWRQQANRWYLALDSLGGGLLRLYQGRAAEAETELAAARIEFQSLGERWGTALTLVELGRLTGWRGDHANAIALLGEALELSRQLDALEDEATILCLRGRVRIHAGSLDAARTDFALAAELAERQGIREIAASAACGSGIVARLSGDLARARQLCERALADCPQGIFGFEEVRGQIAVELGRLAEAEGAADEATKWHLHAFRSGRDWRDLLTAGSAVEGLAGVAVLRGDARRAALLHGAATALRGAAVAGDPDVARVSALARARLGDEVYAAEHARGAALAKADALAVVTAAD
ncbi:BTAD domain-containing putative transcriptional regulator [Saccharomonospora sp. NPDC046836]|uniref:ATP-binding protein n=1 Tax=Saccharomonospora sp. NPDC046836 TaxID=3156921 RepID=UPI0033C99084